MARLLWVACDQPGSLFPAVPLVCELLRRGHTVDAICTASSRTTFEGLGCSFTATPRLDRYLATVPPGRGPEDKRRWQAGYAAALFDDVCERLAGGRFDAALVDPLEVGGGFAAEAAGLPWLSYVHFAMDETGLDVPFGYHFRRPGEPAVEDFVTWWNELRAGVGLGPESRPVEEHRWYRHSPWSTLVLRLPELVHPQGDLPAYVTRVGPSVWHPRSPGPPPGWLHGLGRDRPALLASVSTVAQGDAGQLPPLAEAAAELGLDVVATVAADVELPRLPPRVIRTGFVGHDLLLEHVCLVACHGGNGTVTRATCAGVPQLLMPVGRDQFAVARGAVHAGVAVALGPEEVSPTALAAAIRRLVSDPRYAERARRLAAAASRYDAPGSTADAVEALLH